MDIGHDEERGDEAWRWLGVWNVGLSLLFVA